MKYTNINCIEVPEYVSNRFNQPLANPSKKSNGIELHLERVYKLINEALKNVQETDWEIENRRYHSLYDVEPYGLECVAEKFYIYAKERGQRSPIAIFKNDHLAAEYFVWLVSDGKAKINWELFLDMEL